MKVEPLPVKKIYADYNFNCRGVVTPFEVVELAESIRVNGLQQAIVVQPYNKDGFEYRIIMGHRRHKAFIVLNRDEIPATIKTGLSDLDASNLNFIENLERKDLTILQEARQVAKYIHAGLNMNDIAKRIGKSTGWVNIRIILMRLPTEIQQEVEAGFITNEQIKEIYDIPSVEGRIEAVREIKEAKMRGEKRAIIPNKKSSKREEFAGAKVRNQTEIFQMQDVIRENLGNGVATRALAWAAGEISGFNMCETIKEETDKLGKRYIPPEEVLDL